MSEIQTEYINVLRISVPDDGEKDIRLLLPHNVSVHNQMAPSAGLLVMLDDTNPVVVTRAAVLKGMWSKSNGIAGIDLEALKPFFPNGEVYESSDQKYRDQCSEEIGGPAFFMRVPEMILELVAIPRGGIRKLLTAFGENADEHLTRMDRHEFTWDHPDGGTTSAYITVTEYGMRGFNAEFAVHENQKFKNWPIKVRIISKKDLEKDSPFYRPDDDNASTSDSEESSLIATSLPAMLKKIIPAEAAEVIDAPFLLDPIRVKTGLPETCTFFLVKSDKYNHGFITQHSHKAKKRQCFEQSMKLI